jgi:hypothetical protein
MRRRHSIAAVAWPLAIIVLVGGIVATGWRQQNGQPELPRVAPAPAAPATLTVDRDYYFFVRLVEFTPTKPNGKAWDTDGSAPDADVRLTWRGARLFALPKRKDQFISTWDLFRVDVKDLIVTRGTADVASMINGPIVRVTPGEAVTIEVYDADPMFSDLALKMDLRLDELHEGRNDIKIPPGSGVTRLRIDLIDRATPLAKLIEWQSRGE